MWPQHELLERAFAANPGKPDGGMHRAQRVWAKPGFLERSTAGLDHFAERAVDSDAQRGRAGNSRTEQASLRVLDAGTASRAAAIDAGEQQTGL
jgi:hypothetical protein